MRTAVRFPARVSLEQILDSLARDPDFSQMVTRWERIPPRRASYAEYPAWLDGRISASLRRRGILSLYSHQADALESTHAGKHTVVVTPTASGKTLCYDLPVIDAIAKDPTARALYIFPTKALAQDQLANPEELARRHVEDDVVVIDRNGAPRGEKVLAFVNPPVVNQSLGIRKSALFTGRDIAATLLASGVQTIAFARSRVETELLLTYLRSRFPQPQWPQDLIRGYRGGYLPSERRAIEQGLRDGSVRGVVSTNALELGIDIGALQAAVLLGYPGTVASTWQQMGRAGRREDLSAAFLVATSSPIDQCIVQHPGYVLDRPPEAGLVNPDNLHVLVHHLKCAAFEIPFEARERFGTEDTPGVLAYLDEQGVLHEAGGKYHWSDQAFPAEATSLRTATNDNVVIVDTTGPAPRTVGSEYHDGKARIIGEIDRFAA